MTDVMRIEISLSLDVTPGGKVTICEVTAKATVPERAKNGPTVKVDLVLAQALLDENVRVTDVGRRCGVTPSRISQLIGEGRLRKPDPVPAIPEPATIVAPEPEPVLLRLLKEEPRPEPAEVAPDPRPEPALKLPRNRHAPVIEPKPRVEPRPEPVNSEDAAIRALLDAADKADRRRTSFIGQYRGQI